MLGKFEVAHLIGITRDHEASFRAVEYELTKQGYICFCPVIFDYDVYKSIGDYPNMLDEMCSEKMTIADLLVLVTPEHIGKSTMVRLVQASAYNIPVKVYRNGKLVDISKGEISWRAKDEETH